MMTPLEIDRATNWAILPMVAGIVCWLIGLGLSAFMLFGLGALCASFTEWRIDRGLWMLGGLFLAVFTTFYATCVYFHFLDLLARRAQLIGWPAVDWFIAANALGCKLRFLWSVMRLNRRSHSARNSSERLFD